MAARDSAPRGVIRSVAALISYGLRARLMVFDETTGNAFWNGWMGVQLQRRVGDRRRPAGFEQCNDSMGIEGTRRRRTHPGIHVTDRSELIDSATLPYVRRSSELAPVFM